MDEPLTPATITAEASLVEGVERTPEVDERLREFGMDLEDLTEKTAEQIEAEKAAETSPKEVTTVTDAEEEILGEFDTLEDAQKFIESQTHTEEITPQTPVVEETQTPWQKENREPTEKEVLDYVADQAENRRLEKEVAIKEEQAKTQKAQDDNIQAWRDEWARQYTELEKSGSIPTMKDQTDPNDPGVKARTDIWNSMVKSGKTSLIETYFVDVAPNRGQQPPGANAPIIASTVPSNDDQGSYSYDEIHSAPDLQSLASSS